MGQLCDFFIAPNDAAAAITIDWVGGPAAERERSGGYPTVSIHGLESTMLTGKLEVVITGRTFDDVLATSSNELVAMRDDGEGAVMRLTSALEDALNELAEDRLAQVADAWAAPDSYWGFDLDLDLALTLLTALVGLVRDARSRGWSTYAWVCV